MNKNLIDALILSPLFLMSSGVALGIGQKILQWIGYESSLLTSLMFVIIGILVVMLARDRLLKIQKALMGLTM